MRKAPRMPYSAFYLKEGPRCPHKTAIKELRDVTRGHVPSPVFRSSLSPADLDRPRQASHDGRLRFFENSGYLPGLPSPSGVTGR